MPNIIEAGLVAKGKRFGIIASRFNDFITDRLVGGAIDALTRSGAEDPWWRSAWPKATSIMRSSA